VKAMVGNASFTKPVRIENIKPNRLKNRTDYRRQFVVAQPEQGQHKKYVA